MYQKLLEKVIEIGKNVGKEVLEKYNSQELIQTRIKSDNSLITEEDILSHELLTKAFKEITPTYPIISEEGDKINYEIRKKWDKFWLIDPIDGTREFVEHTGEFTINIALIEGHKPVMGVVVVPTQDLVYFALCKQPAYKQIADHLPTVIKISDTNDDCIRVIISRRSEKSVKMEKFLQSLGKKYKLILCGSTLKLCLVAEGVADIYPRLGNTWEWDTAAGQCILEAAGGTIINLQGEKFLYNTKDSLINSEFMAFGSPEVISGISFYDA